MWEAIHTEKGFLFLEKKEFGKSLGRLPVGGTERAPAFTTYTKFRMTAKSALYTPPVPSKIAAINATGWNAPIGRVRLF